MKKRQILMTTLQFDRLMAELLALPAEPVGNHLSDEEFLRYYREDALSSRGRADIERHLISCPDCEAETERLLKLLDTWHGPQGEQRFERIRAKMLPNVRSSLQSAEEAAASTAVSAACPEE